MRRGRSRYSYRDHTPQEGWVYVFSNSAMPGILKVGRTSGSLEKRAAELHGTGIPKKFRVEIAVRVTDCVALEGWLHARFRKDRVNARREFFTTALSELIAAIEIGVPATRVTCIDDHDVKGRLTATRARWAREAAERAETDRLREIQEVEARRVATIEAELEQEISRLNAPMFRIRLIIGGITLLTFGLIVLALSVLALRSKEYWWLVVPLWLGASWSAVRVITFLFAAISFLWPGLREIGAGEAAAVERLRTEADEKIRAGAKPQVDPSPPSQAAATDVFHVSAAPRPEPPPKPKTQPKEDVWASTRSQEKVVLACFACETPFRVPKGIQLVARCPKCGKRNHCDTR